LSEGGGGLFIVDIDTAVRLCDHVRAPGVEKGMAGYGVVDGKRNCEGKFNAGLAVGELNGLSMAAVEGVVLEVKFEGTGCPFERLGAVGRALEIPIFEDQSRKACCDGIRDGKTLFVVSAARGFDAISKGPSRDKVDRLGGGLPVLDILAEGFLWAGAERPEHGRVNGDGEERTFGHSDTSSKSPSSISGFGASSCGTVIDAERSS
jgi:hypothetical protein